MNTTLWIVQSLLALAFIAAGAMKLFAYEKYETMSEKRCDKAAGLDGECLNSPLLRDT